MSGRSESKRERVREGGKRKRERGRIERERVREGGGSARGREKKEREGKLKGSMAIGVDSA